MKNILVLIFFGLPLWTLAYGPVVPSRIEFADISLKLTEGARRDIQKDVDLLTRSPKYFNIKVERAKTYFPIIERIFDQEGVPEEFKYLVLQESALIPDAVSSANAVGFWQMKDFTAMELGLRVDRNVDERMNIVSATYGATRYFKKANSTFENWLNALQSYQMGIGGASRALGDKDRGKKSMTISKNTYWYVKKFLAHMIAFQGAVEGNPVNPVTEFVHSSSKSLEDISKETKKSLDEVEALNKWLLKGKIPADRVYTVILPGDYQAVQDVVASKEVTSKPIERKPKYVNQSDMFPKILDKRYKDHKYIIGVNGLPGIIASSTDNIETLARKGDVSMSQFLRFNDLSSKAKVIPGQVYYLQKKKRKADTHYHTLQTDETLWHVSQKYGLRLDKLVTKNRMVENSNAKPGRVLWLRFIRPKDMPVEYSKIDKTSPGEDADAAITITETLISQENNSVANEKEAVEVTEHPSEIPDTTLEVEEDHSITYPTAGKQKRTHTVTKGETYYSISKIYGIAVGALLQWNDREISDTIFIGDKLDVYIEKLPDNVIKHKVKPGDTMYRIARSYSVSIDNILKWNNKMDSHLKVGEILMIYQGQ